MWPEIHFYRVRQYPNHPLRRVRRAWYGRTWQAEWEWSDGDTHAPCYRCPRGYTLRGCQRKAARWVNQSPRYAYRRAQVYRWCAENISRRWTKELPPLPAAGLPQEPTEPEPTEPEAQR